MIEQLNNSVKFMAFFTSNKVGKTGITVTIDVFNPSGTKIVTDGTVTELGDGIYTYVLASTNTSSEGEYIAVFKTADSTVDMQNIPSLWVIGRGGIEHLDSNISDKATQTSVNAIPIATLLSTDSRLDNLDAKVSTRATETSVSAIPTNPLLSTDTRLGNLDSKISSIPTSPLLSTDTRLDNLDSKVSLIPKNPLLTNDSRLDNLDAKISTISGGGSPLQSTDTRLDKLANLDAAISTRASQTSVNSIPTNPLLTDDTRLNNIDATISSRSTQTSVSAIPTSPLLSNDSRLNNLDVAVSTRSTQSSVDSITGSGKTKWTYTLTLPDGVTPIPNANIWITSDIEGNNIIGSTVTDSYGQANFAVDKGAVYVWISKTGYKFNNPDMEVIA